MPYTLFYERFPELAEEETRSLILLNDPELPDDEYAFIESYCDEPDCDCRRVFFNVLASRRNKILAVIAYGWESKRFYANWFGANDPETIRDLQGPILNPASPQSKLAPTLLQKVEDILLKDRNYVNRLKRHYAMFKEAIDKEEVKQSQPRKPASVKKISRNAPCPCGSGKKYKKCCGK